MYSFTCIKKILRDNKQGIQHGKPNGIIEHVARGMPKVTVYGQKSHQYHNFYIYDIHPYTKKKIDGGIVYPSDIEKMHDKDIIDVGMKNEFLSRCCIQA